MASWKPSTDRPQVLDLADRWNDVVSMAKSHNLWDTAIDLGWDDEDLEQEVLLRVHNRQSMASRYDPERAGLGKYLFILTRGILLNLIDMRCTVRVRSEALGLEHDVAIDDEGAS